MLIKTRKNQTPMRHRGDLPSLYKAHVRFGNKESFKSQKIIKQPHI